VEHDLEQQVAELVLQVVQVAALDGVGDFIGFLDRVGSDGDEGLDGVPFATGIRIAEAGHDLDQAVNLLQGHAYGPLRTDVRTIIYIM
jgi:hypothetical protein